MSLIMPNGSYTRPLPSGGQGYGTSPPTNYLPGFNPRSQDQYGRPISQAPAAPRSQGYGNMAPTLRGFDRPPRGLNSVDLSSGRLQTSTQSLPDRSAYTGAGGSGGGSLPSIGRDAAAYRPGQARSIQPQPGTPYRQSGQSADGLRPAVMPRSYSPQTFRSQSGPVDETGFGPGGPIEEQPVDETGFVPGGPLEEQPVDETGFGPGGPLPGQQISDLNPAAKYTQKDYYNSNLGNYGNGGERPDPFTQSAIGVDGKKYSDPSQAYAQRDALIERLNNAKSQYVAKAGTYLGEGKPPAGWGSRPQYDFGTLIGQANDMVAAGWSNPFARQSSAYSIPRSQFGVSGSRREFA